MSTTSRPSEGRAAVEAAIPHRDPFLFVDAVLDETADSLRSTWCVPADAAWFQGHYPGQPITPGCLLSEHVFQSAAILISHTLGGIDTGGTVPVLTKIENARFKRMVLPGETVKTEVRVKERVSNAWYMGGIVRVEEAIVLRIGFVLSAVPAPPHIKAQGANT